MSVLWLSRLLFIPGFLVIAAGAIALRWPAETLAFMLTVSGAGVEPSSCTGEG